MKNFHRVIVIITVLLVASTLAAWYITKSVAEKETARIFNDEAGIIESWITNRFELYKTIAYGLQAFLSDNETVDEKKWQSYVETLKIKERFPGLTTITFIKRQDGSFIVTFIYPPVREATMGIDVITQPRRFETINRAIDTASPSITDKILLVGDQNPGFVMYTPVYKRGVPVETVEERRAAARGLVAIIFKSEQAFKDLFDTQDTCPYLDFELYKGKILEENHILYDHDYSFYIPKGEPRNRLEAKRTIISDGETFTLLVATKPSFGLRTLEKQLPNIVLITGLVFSFLIFFFTLSRFQRLQKKKTKKASQGETL